MKKLSTLLTASERRTFLKEERSVLLDKVEKALVDDEKNVRIENIIGATSVPLGVAGPLTIHGDNVDGEFYIPLATTEGALVGSINRGSKAISLAGGAKAYVHRVGTTRGPVFYVGSIENNKKFYVWLKENESGIAQVAEATSSHLTYKKMKTSGLADYRFVNFYFDTDDAMGMNMATIATQAIIEFIEKETGFSCLSIAGNFDIDKKPAWMNMINNRGFKVWAEVSINAETVLTVLKTTPQKVYDVWLAKCMLGSAMSGSLGFNAHYANVVAALFIATGQDPAHVVEGSMGITTARVLENGNLYMGVYLPAILLGTVGAGTQLKTQQEALQLLGVKKSPELAEVVGGAVLAGELSLLSALAEGSLSKAHQKFGRTSGNIPRVPALPGGGKL